MAPLKIAALWFRSRILRDRGARWDYQYAVGKWEKLKSEDARIAATATLLERHAPAGRVLEVGCGEALLQPKLTPGTYTKWVGIDLSEVAIQKAQVHGCKNVHYILADMETFSPDDRFDAIVFTESIYYSADCARLLMRYTQFLTATGVFIISICHTKRSDRIWEDIHSVTTTIDAATTTSGGHFWDCEVLSAT